MSNSVPQAGSGRTCDTLVEGSTASYPCALPAGHGQTPPGDPEPCKAIEVPRSVRKWEAWRQRNEGQGNAPVTVNPRVGASMGQCGRCQSPLRINGADVVCDAGHLIGAIVGSPREVHPEPSTSEEASKPAALAPMPVVELVAETLNAAGASFSVLSEMAYRAADREGMEAAVRRAIADFWLSARYSEESEPDWDGLAAVSVDAILAHLAGPQ